MTLEDLDTCHIKNYKIIYLLDPINNTVEIFDVFDTKQNPVKMNREN